MSEQYTVVDYRRVYYVRPVGLFRFEIWWHYKDWRPVHPAVSGDWAPVDWLASSQRFRRRLSAVRVCQDLQRAFDEGWRSSKVGNKQ